MEGFEASVVKDLYMKGEFWGPHANPTYEQESAAAFLGCSVLPGKAKQHSDAAHHRTQVGNVEQVRRGQLKDSPRTDPCEDSPSEPDIDAQTNEDHARHL